MERLENLVGDNFDPIVDRRSETDLSVMIDYSSLVSRVYRTPIARIHTLISTAADSQPHSI